MVSRRWYFTPTQQMERGTYSTIISPITLYHFTKKWTLRKKCSYSEFFWSVFFPIWTEYLRISPYSVRMREDTDQKNSEYGTFYIVKIASIFTGLTPPNFFLWGYLKERIYANPKSENLEKLKENIC